MKPILALFLLVLPQAADWPGEWKHRRKLALRNNLDGPLAAGYPVSVELDVDYLGLGGKAKKDLSDLLLTHKGKTLPFCLLPGRTPRHHALWFRTAEDLPPAGADPAYAIHYGNPAATNRPEPPDKVFDFYEDFSRPESLKEKFEVDRDVEAAVRDGALVIRQVSAERSESAPGRIALKAPLPKGGFALSFDLEIEASHAHSFALALNVDMKDPAAAAPELGRKLDDLVEKLGDLDWETREKATQELIKIGKPGIAKLIAATKSADSEVKWRAEHVLKEIRERAGAPTIRAGVYVGDAGVGPVALAHAIGKNRGKLRHGAAWPVRLRVTVLRDQDHDVTLLWNNGRPQTGHLPGEVEQISFTVYRGGADLGTVRVDNLALRRHVDEDSRPTHTLEVEETRP